MPQQEPGPAWQQPRYLKRVVLAIVAAYIANILLITVTDQVLARLFADTRYLMADVATQCLIQVACGYLCARISDAAIAIGGLTSLGLVVGAFSVATSWHAEPHWYSAALLVLYAPSLLMGYRLALHRRVSAAGDMQ